jgi:hypothetical protein
MVAAGGHLLESAVQARDRAGPGASIRIIWHDGQADAGLHSITLEETHE